VGETQAGSGPLESGFAIGVNRTRISRFNRFT
jgi:hypothetical protein